jgi:hypothetical protein
MEFEEWTLPSIMYPHGASVEVHAVFDEKCPTKKFPYDILPTASLLLYERCTPGDQDDRGCSSISEMRHDQ